MSAMLEQMDLGKKIASGTDAHANRRLPFSGAKNFRDLGGYKTVDGRTVRRGLLYRSDRLHKLTDEDLKFLSALSLERIIDFRAEQESQREPDRLPAGTEIHLVAIPISDSSTTIWIDSRDEMVKSLKNIDPARSMIATNVELATRFTPEMRQFMGELLNSNGRPLLFHCTAGKDRTGFAAAISLRMLGVPHETVVEDYLLTNQYFFSAYKWSLVLMQLLRGKRFVDNVKGFMMAHPSYLSAAFEAIDREHGSFENYARDGLGLAERDVEQLKMLYLE
jgi:protein-tyrosine phosphatase